MTVAIGKSSCPPLPENVDDPGPKRGEGTTGVMGGVRHLSGNNLREVDVGDSPGTKDYPR